MTTRDSLRVQINGENRDVADRSTLSDLIAELALAPQRIAVEVNQQIVRRNDWARTVLNDGDRIEIVHFVGGGATGRRMQTADEMRSSRNFRLIVNRCKVDHIIEKGSLFSCLPQQQH